MAQRRPDVRPAPFAIPRSTSFPWRAVLLILGALLVALAGISWGQRPTDAWLLATGAAAVTGGTLVAAGIVLWLIQRRGTARGLELGLGNGQSYSLTGLVALLCIAFVVMLLPFPSRYAWLGDALSLACVAGAAYVGWLRLRTAAPAAYMDAQRAYQRDSFGEALALLADLARERPGFVATHHLRALVHRARRDYAAAHESAQQLIALRPDLYYGYAEEGLTSLAEGQPGAALGALRRAAELAPELAEAHFNLGMACAEADAQVEAVNALSRALRLGLRDQVTELLARYHLYRALQALDQAEAARAERGRLRRRAGVLRRWRREVGDGQLSAHERRRELTLIAAIERVLPSEER